RRLRAVRVPGLFREIGDDRGLEAGVVVAGEDAGPAKTALAVDQREPGVGRADIADEARRHRCDWATTSLRQPTKLSRHDVMSLRCNVAIMAFQRSLRSSSGMTRPRCIASVIAMCAHA